MDGIMRRMIKQAKSNVDKMEEEINKYPGGKELYTFPDGMTLDELIIELSKIKEEHDGDIPVFFQTQNGSDICATGLRWDGLTSEDLCDEYYGNLPSAVIVKLNDN